MIEIKNKTWDDVTIEMWQELNAIQTDSEVTRIIEQISILTDVDSEEIRKLKMREFADMQASASFIYTQPKAEVTLKFELDGKKYGMIPHLDFITTGEWMDAENWKDKAIENLHLYAALIYRPIVSEDGDDYKIEDHKSDGFMKRAELFRKKLSINIIHGAVLFFSSSAIGFTKILVDYLNQEMQTELLTKKKQILQVMKTHKE
jgi:hypothetical protein